MKKLHLFLLLTYNYALQSSAENNEQNVHDEQQQLFYYVSYKAENPDKIEVTDFSSFQLEKFVNFRRKAQDTVRPFDYRGYSVYLAVHKKTKPLLARGQIFAFVQYEIDMKIANACLSNDDDKTKIINHMKAEQKSSDNMYHEKFKHKKIKDKSSI